MYPNTIGWVTINIPGEIERRFPGMPERLVNNLIEPKALISVDYRRIVSTLRPCPS